MITATGPRDLPLLLMTLTAAALTAAGGCEEVASTAPAAPPQADLVKLSPAALKNAGLTTVKAGPAKLGARLTFQGDFIVPPQRRAKVVSRVKGVVQEVRVNEGDPVTRGQLVAVIQSRELGEAALAYLEATHKVSFARAALKREEQLLQKKISAREQYLKIEHALEEAVIARRTALQRLQVLGLGEPAARSLTRRSQRRLSRYELRAPVAGTVLQRKVSLGQAVSDATELLEIADLSRISVEFPVPAASLPGLTVGQQVEVSNRQLGLRGAGRLSWISPVVDRATRTIRARALIDNSEGAWRPGLCGEVKLQGVPLPAAVAVPAAALVELSGQPALFVQQAPGAFRVRRIKTGRTDGQRVQVLEGLRAGELVVARNAVVLKTAWQQQAGE